ncbi:MAG TPA: PAS domain-containing protein, partial [Flavisolibacter sp.]|nr:PAS domain-containing protein [Flavisolibacter sp.]
MTGSLLKEAEGYLNLAAGIVVEIDADLIVRFINERGCLILEASKEEIIGKNWFDHFLPGDKRAEMKALFVALFQTPGRPIQKLETTVLTKKGNTRFISWYNTIIKEEKGRIPAILGLGEDIT